MKKPSEAIQKSRKFLVRMLQVFFDRMKPASTMPNPACIKNTRNAAMSTHTVSIAILFSSGVAGSSAYATALRISTSARPSRADLTLIPHNLLNIVISPYYISCSGG